MSNKDKANKTSFKPGHSGGGRKPLSPETRAARAMSYEEMIKEIIDVRSTPLSIAKEMIKNKQDDIPLGKLAILRAWIGNKSGPDFKAIEYFEKRLYGMPVEIIEYGKDLTPQTDVNSVRDSLKELGCGVEDNESTNKQKE